MMFKTQKLSRFLFTSLVVSVLVVLSILPMIRAKAATAITITSPTNNSSGGGSFTVSGTATANRKITVKVNGTQVGKTTSDGSGNWSLNVSGQSSGQKTIEATASYQEFWVNDLNAGSPSSSVMTKINDFDKTVIGTFPAASGGASFLAWYPNPAFTKAYGVAGSLGSPLVHTIDLTNETVGSFTMAGTSPNPGSAAFNDDASKVYIVDGDTSNDIVRIYNTSTDAEITSITGFDNPSQSTKRPNSNEIWVTNTGNSIISIIDTTTDTITSSFSMTNAGVLVTFSPDGSRAFLSDSNATSTIDAYNASTHAFLGTIPLSTSMGVAQTVMNNAGTRLYATSLTTGRVDVLDPVNLTNLGYVAVQNDTVGAAVSYDDSDLYVTSPNFGGGMNGTIVTVIDTSTNTISNEITVAAAPLTIRAVPPELATASVTYTVGVLADTGENQQAYIITAAVFIGGAIAIIATRRLASHGGR